MYDCRLVVVSCPRRAPIQEIWKACQRDNWPDCPFPIDIISQEKDLGWNANLIAHIEKLSETFVLLMLDDNFIEPLQPLTSNIRALLELMKAHTDVGMCKLQAGGAQNPDIYYQPWPRLREYDRQHHPYKRTNLIPCMYRREWLLRLSGAVLNYVKGQNGSDNGRQGAIEFEVTGTLLTEDAHLWPERMLGINRPNADGGGGDSLLICMANDAVLEGKMRDLKPLRKLCEGVAGIEAFF